MRRRQKDIWDQPWVPVAAVVGVIAVIAIAVFFFLGSGGSEGTPAATVSTGTTSSGSTVVASGKLNPSAVKELPTVSVPGDGVFVKVSYLGSYSGEYGMAGSMLAVKDSGERVYEIENANGTVSATFRKIDPSTKPHELSVEIWKDGKVLKYEKNTSQYGEVRIDYSL
ncbi:MAG: hypothetical protein M0Q92_07905 [Methanoregula sp.]|jgi:hypothetical protein|nr:hypothetical protein [Methanoregula sp.]